MGVAAEEDVGDFGLGEEVLVCAGVYLHGEVAFLGEVGLDRRLALVVHDVGGF